jgi:DNA polymerase
LIGAADLAGIELRLNMWFSDQNDVLDDIRSGNDLYIAEAARQFSVSFAQVSKTQRQYGKVVQLAAGYGMSANKFKQYCASGPMGMEPFHLSDEEAQQTIRTYRKSMDQVVRSWAYMNELIRMMAAGTTYRHKGVTTQKGQIILPSGLPLQYPRLFAKEDGWRCGMSGEQSLHGALLQQNIVQALARCVLAEHMLKVERHFRIIGHTHDELIFLVPRGASVDVVHEIMSTPPTWAPELPLAAEVVVDAYYAK